MSPDETVDKALEIIGEAVSIDPSDFQDHETWKFLGFGDNLASATASDLKNEGINVTASDFSKYPTVGDFKAFLRGDKNAPPSSAKQTSPPSQTLPQLTVPSRASSNAGRPSIHHSSTQPPSAASQSLHAANQPLRVVRDPTLERTDPWEGIPKPKVPLSVALQGQPSTSSTTIFLFPDGSGAGTSYGTLPLMGGEVCLIGLNSPFLRQAQDFTCSIERMARLWVGEVRKLQPRGQPYILGGWSAGGYYAFEVAKLLTAAGEKVERIILIDSPCRLEFEALPESVVAELTRRGLMGASGQKKAPEWLVQHFTSTVISVDKYMPTPMERSRVPKHVNFIWVREGLVKSVEDSGLDVDLNVKVTRFLLEPRGDLKTVGWEKLLPGAEYSFDYMTGNHFQITQPPHVSVQILSQQKTS